MPRVLDNITDKLLDALRVQLLDSTHAEFCVGYLHIRGWRKIGDIAEQFQGSEGSQVRVLVGMTQTPEQELLEDLRLGEHPDVNQSEARRRHTRLVEAFRKQLTVGLPDNVSTAAIRQLARQLRERKVVVKLFLRHSLHAKLYLTFNNHPGAPIVAFLGSSNLTGPGLAEQGELNVDVTDNMATEKLRDWFKDRWSDQFAPDISDELANLLLTSWAREEPFSPYLVFLKIAFHLAQDALEAPKEYRLPKELEEIVLDFQRDAIFRVRRVLREDSERPGNGRVALLGDVVGMGKTLSATAIAKLFQEDEGGKCVVCCPPKLAKMWQDYLHLYEVTGLVVPYSQSHKLKEIPGRSRLIVLDESHNLRNRETLAWANVRDYVRDQDARVLLLSATPYNKHYEDLANQLRLAVDDNADLGIRPEAYFREVNEADFVSRFQASPRSLSAFAQSTHSDDWRDLLKSIMVRRTRGHIIQHNATFDEQKQRYFLTLSGDKRSYFPKRTPLNVEFSVDESNPQDQYARLFTQAVVDVIEHLSLPRYGLGQANTQGNPIYLDTARVGQAPPADKELIDNLSVSGNRLIGYCKINLFKRLESSGHAFLLSLKRHVLRNLVFVYAIDNGLDLPIGTQDSSALDSATSDADIESSQQVAESEVTEEGLASDAEEVEAQAAWTGLEAAAAKVYAGYADTRKQGRKQFRWLSSSYFLPLLKERLLADAQALYTIMQQAGPWRPDDDTKLQKIHDLLTQKEKHSKALVFTQFADSALYLAEQLKRLGMTSVEAVTAESPDPAGQVRRFSPVGNGWKLAPSEEPIRVLVATEVLSEGQNCQDASVVVNFDLPWAIIRLIQRAGRVDRIGQDNDEIRIYSCVPATGVERIINLRSRLVGRLNANREVIGTDERFFEEEGAEAAEALRNLYAQNIDLDDPNADADDVDVCTMAQGIWQDAIATEPGLEKKVKSLPDQVYATRNADQENGALVYFKTADGFDSLLKVNPAGEVVTQSLVSVLKEAECGPGEPGLPPHPVHHEIVRSGIEQAMAEVATADGALGPKRSARRRLYERLTNYLTEQRARRDLFAQSNLPDLEAVINDLQKYPLTERARDKFNRRFREGVNDDDLLEMAIDLRADGRLSYVEEEGASREPKLICSIGLFPREQCVAADGAAVAEEGVAA